jgi:hypothetical protein
MCFSSSNFAYRIVGFEELGNVDSFCTATLELRLLHTGSVFFTIKRRGLNIVVQGVIQKEPLSLPVVNNVRAMATHGSRLRQNHHDDDDDFDL